ncbi:hypothetical protein DIURU_001540 [Diutina rugosa]|uniref:PITH domain-containing protein n=1 Tax=Diutina rugosa TaxID=5481 RepID=A0A642UTG7_DIURU|nr:uncharacterized protein DIURU_001540 [Diutina rugosa]KAA8905112.1 hypothetical protein DIURU_001540 [Diutina rugosa]
MAPLDVETREEFDSILAENKYVFVYCYSNDYTELKRITPKVEELANSGDYPDVKIIRVNLETATELKQLAQAGNAEGELNVPTYLFYELGKQGTKLTGADNYHEVFDMIDQLQTDIDQSGEALERRPNALEQGFKVLNHSIDFQKFEQFNVQGDGSQVFKIDVGGEGVWSDADSQLMFFFPLKNMVKVHSVFIKARSGVVIDEDDGETAQQPSTIKLWPSLPQSLSFEEADADKNPADVQSITFDGEWAELKLKYVRFQKVSSLCIFIDGDDEDTVTSVDQIVILGVPGDPIQASVI